jgi:hypothetical protein
MIVSERGRSIFWGSPGYVGLAIEGWGTKFRTTLVATPQFEQADCLGFPYNWGVQPNAQLLAVALWINAYTLLGRPAHRGAVAVTLVDYLSTIPGWAILVVLVWSVIQSGGTSGSKHMNRDRVG